MLYKVGTFPALLMFLISFVLLSSKGTEMSVFEHSMMAVRPALLNIEAAPKQRCCDRCLTFNRLSFAAERTKLSDVAC